MNWQAYRAFQNRHPKATESEFLKAFCGEWRSKLVFAKDHWDQHFLTCEKAKRFINFDKYAEHLFSTKYVSVERIGGVVWVFERGE